jgi:hypothetical protein
MQGLKLDLIEHLRNHCLLIIFPIPLMNHYGVTILGIESADSGLYLSNELRLCNHD